MAKVKLTSPWVTFQHQVEAFFAKDPEVKVQVNGDTINLFVNNPTKAEALTELLPTSKDYNGHIVKINVIPANDFEVSPATLFQQALEGNPIFNDVFVVQGMYNNPVTYVIFEDQVAQYWNDNLGDPHGNVSTLYQELAQKIFDVEGINYCTKEIEK